MRVRRATEALVTGVVVSLAATLGTTATAGAEPDDPRLPAAASAAQRTLGEARAVLRGEDAAPTREATLVLRDLMQAREDLTGADLRTADALLARPTDSDDRDYYGDRADVLRECGTHVCVHYVTTGDDAATPTYATRVLTTLEDVHTTYVDAGYRAPKPDGTRGGDARTDIYLSNIGEDNLFGYCTSDEPFESGQYDYWAYCVLDNDYSPAEFGRANTPIENMKVTAAHEYFHAVQFAYDAFEDDWLMEATATWAEDEVFDGVDDNVNFLPAGQLGSPRKPLDGFFGSGNAYGNWIFFRFLTEAIPAETGQLPTLVRTIWENADSTKGQANDQYSLKAVSNALADARFPLRKAYATFAAVNREPREHYEEGAANSYPTPPLARRPFTLTPRDRRTARDAVTQDHLTNDTVRFQPSRRMSRRSWKLRLRVDMARRVRGSHAIATVSFRDGTSSRKPITLNRRGDGATRVPFSRRRVKHVELTMVNASERTRCWRYPGGAPYSCDGTPTDDDLRQQFRGIAFR